MQPFTKRLVEILPNQFHKKAVVVDSYLRVQGAPKGTVYAMGDAATVQTDLVSDLLNLWDKYDANKDAVMCVPLVLQYRPCRCTGRKSTDQLNDQ